MAMAEVEKVDFCERLLLFSTYMVLSSCTKTRIIKIGTEITKTEKQGRARPGAINASKMLSDTQTKNSESEYLLRLKM